MRLPLELVVNGRHEAGTVRPGETLLDFLRHGLHLTGTKQGCENGNCGSCVVLLDGRPVNACLVLALEAAGRQVTTIEGLGGPGGELHPVQQAFVAEGAIQCGFCTPGMVMAAKALLDRRPDPSEGEIVEAISGHLCRCTGYHAIVAAVKAAGRAQREGDGV